MRKDKACRPHGHVGGDPLGHRQQMTGFNRFQTANVSSGVVLSEGLAVNKAKRILRS
jgi:hypothetical protein